MLGSQITCRACWLNKAWLHLYELLDQLGLCGKNISTEVRYYVCTVSQTIAIKLLDYFYFSQWDLYCSQFYKVALSQSLKFFGMLLGSWFLNPLADKIGRRKVYFYTSVLFFVATLLSALSLSYMQFAFCRFLIGLVEGVCFSSYFVILMEVIGPDYRAVIGMLNSACFSIAFPLLSILVYIIPSWRILTGVLSVAGLLHLTAFQ